MPKDIRLIRKKETGNAINYNAIITGFLLLGAVRCSLVTKDMVGDKLC